MVCDLGVYLPSHSDSRFADQRVGRRKIRTNLVLTLQKNPDPKSVLPFSLGVGEPLFKTVLIVLTNTNSSMYFFHSVFTKRDNTGLGVLMVTPSCQRSMRLIVLLDL